MYHYVGTSITSPSSTNYQRTTGHARTQQPLLRFQVKHHLSQCVPHAVNVLTLLLWLLKGVWGTCTSSFLLEAAAVPNRLGPTCQPSTVVNRIQRNLLSRRANNAVPAFTEHTAKIDKLTDSLKLQQEMIDAIKLKDHAQDELIDSSLLPLQDKMVALG